MTALGSYISVADTGTLFRISLYRNGLMLIWLDDDTNIAALVGKLDGRETAGG
ncbi:hypothetical protein [Dickeya oryzae]